ncbi:hypothetical protein ABBQ32_013514 [Trebouxia sp. C0010 RCD-2024]
MSLLLNRPTTAAVQGVSQTATLECRDRIAKFRSLLQQTVQEAEGADKQTLRLWLVGAASRLAYVDTSRVWRRVACLLPAGGFCSKLSKTCSLQLLQLVCEADPAKVGRLLCSNPKIVRDFFQDHPQHISTWFQSSYVRSISEFKNGAKALAQYALLHRAEMWELLVWQGKHAQAPVAVAAKPHYFSELNVNKTIRNILKHHPEFFASEQFLGSLSDGTVTALDRAYFCQELLELLVDEDADVRNAIRSCIIEQPFKLICHRLLHHLDDASLLNFLNGILGQAYSQRQLHQLASTGVSTPGLPMERALWASQRLQQCLELLVFGCVSWRELNSMSTHVALSFHHPQLQRAFQASHRHQELCYIANALCESSSAPVFWALLSEDARESDSCMYHTLLLGLWAVQTTIFQKMAVPQQQQLQFLTDNSISASISLLAQHALLRPAKRRKSHKHKRRKSHKKQRRSLPEDWTPSSGSAEEEGMSDSDLGIMAIDHDHQMSQSNLLWQIQLASPVHMHVNASTLELPSVLLYNVIVNWLVTLQRSGLAP